jgi:hypothetical protein
LKTTISSPVNQNINTIIFPREPAQDGTDDGQAIAPTEENDVSNVEQVGNDLEESWLSESGGPEGQVSSNAAAPAPNDSMFPDQILSEIQYEDIDLEALSALAKLSHIKQAMDFICTLEEASLDNRFSKLNPEGLCHLWDPPTCPVDISSPDLYLGLDLFLSTINSSQQTCLHEMPLYDNIQMMTYPPMTR